MAAARVSLQKISELEGLIGYQFKTHERLIVALTHASAIKKVGDFSHYERLEFLGDRVLGVCVAEMLFNHFPKAKEGELSVRLNALVSGNTCADVADEIGLHGFIHAGTDLKHITSKRMKSVRADVVESLIAAIYLDGGLEAVQGFVKRFWEKRIAVEGSAIRDSKTALQEWAHAKLSSTPVYTIAQRSGPDHDPVFTITVKVPGVKGAKGQGRSKRMAEQAAAQAILLREAVWVKAANGEIKENSK